MKIFGGKLTIKAFFSSLCSGETHGFLKINLVLVDHICFISSGSFAFPDEYLNHLLKKVCSVLIWLALMHLEKIDTLKIGTLNHGQSICTYF